MSSLRAKGGRPALRHYLAYAAFLPAALLGAAALLSGAAPPQPDPLTGQLLVATPSMQDPRFYHAVILMVRHDQKGALGIVINRPIGMRPLAEILKATGDKALGIEGKVRVFAGGPVQPELGFIIHSTDYRRPQTLAIDKHVAMTSNRQVLVDIAHDKGPKQSLIAFGYAGWGPGQLDGELAHHDWYTTPEDPKLVFETDRASLWEDAKARRTREL
ncbi:MAG TPA: YqgE/AlgH family protein [Stellaceae bacterium]|nr:YqgE/AlgH family protein [Stellaceae bacterium]